MRRPFLITLIALICCSLGFIAFCTFMPSLADPKAKLDVSNSDSEHFQQLALQLRAHVDFLSKEIGTRHYREPGSLERSLHYLEELFRSKGFHARRQTYHWRGHDFSNLEASDALTHNEKPFVILGAHYDTTDDGPGANDNASGVAAMLELASWYSKLPRAERQGFRNQLVFVAFVNEEPAFFLSELMGSRVYAAKLAKEELAVRAMLSLETLGYYSDQPDSQSYPANLGLFYPSRGNFVAFVGNLSSASLVREAISVFRQHALVASEGAALPAFIPGVSWSDHSSFWHHGYPAIMITDTAPHRYPHYHTAQDTSEKLNYLEFAKVVSGLRSVIRHLLSNDERGY